MANTKVILSIQQRLDVLKDLETLPVPTVAAKYRVCNRTIERIRDNASKIREFENQNIRQKRRQRLKPPMYSEIDKRLYSWFQERRTLGDHISDALLLKKACELKESMPSCSNFKVSCGWLSKFKSRNDIRLIRIYDKQASSDENAAKNVPVGDIEQFIRNYRQKENRRTPERKAKERGHEDTKNTDEDKIKQNIEIPNYRRETEDRGIKLNARERQRLSLIFEELEDFAPRMLPSTELLLQALKLSVLGCEQ